MSKVCSKCDVDKPIEKFNRAAGNKDGYRSECKECTAKYYRQYKKENNEQLKKSWRDASKRHYEISDNARIKHLRKYGLDLDGYDRLFVEQSGKCKICSREISLVIDHCHVTGKVRGLLCNGCNLALAYFEEKPDRMQKAIEYLSF